MDITDVNGVLEQIVGKSDTDRINKMSPNSKLSSLRSIASEMENGKELAILQRYIVNLMEQRRDSLEFPSDTVTVHPAAYDVLIGDITPQDKCIIGDELGTVALEATEADVAFPIEGILYGAGSRIFIPLIVSKRGVSINVHFLFDTGSPCTYLRSETFAALGYGENIPSDTNVIIHGTAVTAYLAHGQFENVDLLGQDYMVAIRGVVTLDYPLRKCIVNQKR